MEDVSYNATADVRESSSPGTTSVQNVDATGVSHIGWSTTSVPTAQKKSWSDCPEYKAGKATPLLLQLWSMCTRDPSNALGTPRDHITTLVLCGCVGFGQVATKCGWHGYAPFG
ncbi:hypothetical protein AUP68_00346 [Ilyonectria robusta]